MSDYMDFKNSREELIGYVLAEVGGNKGCEVAP